MNNERMRALTDNAFAYKRKVQEAQRHKTTDHRCSDVALTKITNCIKDQQTLNCESTES